MKKRSHRGIHSGGESTAQVFVQSQTLYGDWKPGGGRIPVMPEQERSCSAATAPLQQRKKKQKHEWRSDLTGDRESWRRFTAQLGNK